MDLYTPYMTFRGIIILFCLKEGVFIMLVELYYMSIFNFNTNIGS